MEELINTKRLNLTDNKNVRVHFSPVRTAARTAECDEMIEVLRAEGGESLYNYVEWLGVINEPDIIILSSQHHYFYDEEDMKRISAVINLKQLNQIRNLGEFFSTVFRLLPAGSKLVGSFAENGNNKDFRFRNKSSVDGTISRQEAVDNGIISRNPFMNMIYNLVDLKTNRYLTKEGVDNLFTSNGFKIIDMTDLNGLTYFLAQKIRPVSE